jgi:uncharacterized RDD family membrane protein YckC
MARSELPAPQGRNFTGRRLAAFVVDVLVANFIAFSVPWAVAEVTNGRYRLTGGFMLTYCAPDTSESALTAELKQRALRLTPPSKTYWRTEHCIRLRNLILRDPYVQAEFQADGVSGVLNYSTPLDFNGDETSIVTFNQYEFVFDILFFVLFLAAAWFDSLGTRLLGIRIRTLDGEKLNFAEFGIRYLIIGAAFAPLCLMPHGMFMLSLGIGLALGAILLLPWFKRDSRYRHGLHDVIAGTTAIRVPRAA